MVKRWLLMVTTLGVVGCGDPSEFTPKKPNCERDEVVAWLETDHCPDGWVWGVHWEEIAPQGVSDEFRPRGSEPSGEYWRITDEQTCFEGRVPTGRWGPRFGTGAPEHRAKAFWKFPAENSRVTRAFTYSIYLDTEERHQVSCNLELDVRTYAVFLAEGGLDLWTWHGESETPEYTHRD